MDRWKRHFTLFCSYCTENSCSSSYVSFIIEFFNFVWCPWVKVCLLNMSQDGNLETVTALYFFKWNKYLYTVQKMACSQVENNSIMIDEILYTRKTCTKYQVVNLCPPFLNSMSTFFLNGRTLLSNFCVWGSLNKTLQAFTDSSSRCVGFPWTLGKHQVCCLGSLPFWKVFRGLRGLDITHSYKQLR